MADASNAICNAYTFFSNSAQVKKQARDANVTLSVLNWCLIINISSHLIFLSFAILFISHVTFPLGTQRRRSQHSTAWSFHGRTKDI